MPVFQKLTEGGIRAVVLAPLLIESQVFGAFVACRRRPDSFSIGEREFLRQLSEHVALASHQAQLRGWELFRPYGSGSEYHHLNFKHAPGPSPHAQIHISEHRIIAVRNHLPTN